MLEVLFIFLSKEEKIMTVEKMRYKYSSAMVAIVAHILLLVVCILQLRAIAVVSTAEAKNGITIDTGGLTRREEHTVVSDSEKALRAYIDDEFVDPVAFAFKYEASSLHLDTKGWSPSTVKNKLIWWNWTIVFVIGLAVAIRTRWKMYKALDAEKNHGTIIMEKVSSYDEAFDKRSVAYLLTLLILWAFGIVTYHPIFFGLLGLVIVEWLGFPHCGKENRESWRENCQKLKKLKNFAKNRLRFLKKSGKLKSVDEHPHKHSKKLQK